MKKKKEKAKPSPLEVHLLPCSGPSITQEVYFLFIILSTEASSYVYRLKGEFHGSSSALEAANCHYRLKLITMKTVPEQVNKRRLERNLSPRSRMNQWSCRIIK